MRTPPLPARWRPWQRRKNTAIVFAVTALLWALRCLPARARPALGSLLGTLAWAVARGPRRRAEAQLSRALPQLGPRLRRRTVRSTFVHLGRSAAELLDLPAAVRAAPLDDASEAQLRQALACGRGVLAISAHLGNWELLAQAVAARGLPVAVVAKPLYDPRLTALVDAERRQFGAEVLWRERSSGVRPLLRALAANKVVALLLDQDTRVAGYHVPFFHAPAHTPSAAAVLALRYEIPVVFATTWRCGSGHRFLVERIDVAASLADVPPAERAQRLTAAFAARIEKAVRERPEQWVWLHDRWRRPAPASTSTPPTCPEAHGSAAPRAAVATRAAGASATALMLVALAAGPPKAKAGPSDAKAAPAVTPTAAAPTRGPQPEAARQVSFRCDGMHISERGRRGRCSGNVVLREGNMLLCCAELTAEADASGRWQAVGCVGDVRVQQDDGAAWAERAQYAVQTGVLTLTGAPRLRRGESLLAGRLIRLDRNDGSAEVQGPVGQVAASDAQLSGTQTPAPQPEASQAWREKPLPSRCPLAAAPRPDAPSPPRATSARPAAAAP